MSLALYCHFKIDFEHASRKAAKKVWENINVHGCMFHFCQLLRRKAMTYPELAAKVIIKNSQAETALKLYMRLAFLPKEKIETGVTEIMQFIKDHELENIF